MPFYDLKCKKCGSEFNIKASISDKENKNIHCLKCSSNELETVFKNINIIKSRSSSSECSGDCCHCHHH
jgi:putative FmdB family regulatory protein